MRFYWVFCFLYCAACAQNNPVPPPQATGDTVPDTNQPTVLEKARVDTQKPAEYAGAAPANPRLSVTEPRAAATETGKQPAQHPGFVDVTQLDPSIRLDIRYATTDNFTKAKIYDCPACLLRIEAAQALVKAHRALQKKGFGLKMFDCYRPRPYQQRLWDKVPNPDYVTPPTKGSMHSRGAAVDLTIVDASGKELDMGTPYDFFGVEAHTDYKKHSAKIQANRDLLREALDAVGFKGIRTEWWHFSYQAKDYALSDYVWPCF